jgi:hypothetical protein
MEKNRTEPNRTEINRFEPVFGSVRFKKLKKKIWFGCLFWFKTGPNRKCSALNIISPWAKKKKEEESWNKKRKIGSVRALITWDWLI